MCIVFEHNDYNNGIAPISMVLKNSGHEKLLLQNINQQYGISCHTKFEFNATSGF